MLFIMSTDDSKPTPKKRGRKPKNPVVEETSTNTVISVESSVSCDIESTASVEHVKPLPKKRGRKPKGGKIVVPESPVTDNVEPKMNVILHLKCSLKDLHVTHGSYMEPYNSTISAGFEPLSGDVQSSAGFGSNYVVSSNQQSQLKSNPVEEVFVDPEVDDNEMKTIWNKLKQLEQNLHHNQTDNFKSDCFWCTCSFDNPPIFIPKCFLKDTYQVYGCFCTPECASAFLMDENIDSSAKFERYYLLNHIYGAVYNYSKNIKPAPSPYYVLDKYYGNMTIQEYRALLSDERLFLIVDKPMTRIMPELHQTNDDHIISNKIISTNQPGKKMKKLATKNEALAENFGLQQGK